jgi:hypothetical protein
MAILEGGVAVTVIGCPLLRILQHVIGVTDRLELRFRFLAPRIAVRMAFHRQAAIGGLDRLLVRAPLDLEQLVKIYFSHLPESPLPFWGEGWERGR